MFCERSPQERIRDFQFQSFLKESTQVNNNSKKNLKQNSPFKLYFDSQIKSYEISNESTHMEHDNLNEFYSPCLFNILRDQLYLIPLWSGIMVNGVINGYVTKTRLTNNPVENYFGQLKNNLLDNKKVI